MERRLAAILAIDIVGYSALMRRDEEGTLAGLIDYRQLVDRLALAHGGRTFGTAGDSMLAEFSSPVEAVRCAINIQSEVTGINTRRPEGSRMLLRIGVNLGDVMAEGENLYGDGVNVAARMESLSEPGGMCISGSAYEQVRDRVDIAFSDMGDQEVKNIDRPVRAWQWRPQAGATAPAQTLLALPDKPSIVVLPFDNMSRDPEQEYFSDGINEDIITDLSKVSALFVIARNSAFVYKGKAVNIPDVCRELGVKFALEGSVRKAGNRVRINAQLIEGSSGGHLWAERYDRELTDIFEVQDDVTQKIVGALKVTLTPSEESRIADSGPKNVDAHDYFMKGRALMFGLKRNAEMFEKATALFRRAIEIDPNYGAPYAGLGLAYMLDHQNSWTDSPKTSIEKADRFVSQAIARDDKDPFAHFVDGMVAMFKKDHKRWADSADRALELNPNFALALSQRGMVHIYTGEPLKSVPGIEAAMRLDPAFQSQYMHFLGTAYFVAGDYKTAETLFRQRIVIDPTSDLSHSFLASVLGQLGRFDEARETWRKLMEINPDYSHAEHIGRLPFTDPADAEKFTDGLRKAGLTA